MPRPIRTKRAQKSPWFPGTAPDVLAPLHLVPASIFIVGLIAALIGIGLMAVMVIDGIGCDVLNHWQRFRAMWTGSQPQAWFLPHWRIPVNMIGAFVVFGFCSLLVAGEVLPTSPVSRIVAAYTLVLTEFSHDRTCPASSKERPVARLKEFKETKPPRVLFAEQAPSGNVHFRIDTCEKPAP